MPLQTTTLFSPFHNLANELLRSILDYLERSSIINISHVSQRLRTVASAHEDYYFFAQLTGPTNNQEEFYKRYMVFLQRWSALGDRPRLLKVRLFAYRHIEAPSITDMTGPINEFCAAIAAGYVVRLQLDLQGSPGRNDLLSQLSVTPAPALHSVRLIMHGPLPDIAFANNSPLLRHVTILNGHWFEDGTQHVDRPPLLNPLFTKMRFVRLEGVHLHSLCNIGRYFPSAETVHIQLLDDVRSAPDVSTWRVWPFPASARKITVDATKPWMRARCGIDEDATVMNRFLEIFGHVVPRITSGQRTTVSITRLYEGMLAKAGKAIAYFIKASAANDPLHVEVKIHQEINSRRISPPYAILRIGSTSYPAYGTIITATLVGNGHPDLWNSVVEKLVDLGQRLESLDAPSEFHIWLRGDAGKLMRVMKAAPSLRTQLVVEWNE